MSTADIQEILNEEKAWLESHPSMQPWEEGCRRVVRLLEDCLRRYSEMVRERTIGGADVDRPMYLARLWQCLGYHWRDAVGLSPGDEQIAASRVAERIAAGRGYRRGEQLGGDPLRDVVLAVAMVRKTRGPRGSLRKTTTLSPADSRPTSTGNWPSIRIPGGMTCSITWRATQARPPGSLFRSVCSPQLAGDGGLEFSPPLAFGKR